MPLYEFSCNKCFKIFEELCKIGEPNPPSPCCNSSSKRLISSCSFKMKGKTPKFYGSKDPDGIPLGEVPGDEDYQRISSEKDDIIKYGDEGYTGVIP